MFLFLTKWDTTSDKRGLFYFTGDAMAKTKFIDTKLSETPIARLLEVALEKQDEQFSDFLACIQILEGFCETLKDSDDARVKILIKMAQDQISKFRSR